MNKSVREEIQVYGINSISEESLLGLVLNDCEVAKTLFERYGSLREMSRVVCNDMEKIKGLGKGKLAKLQAVLALGRKLQEEPFLPKDKIDNSEKVWKVFGPRIGHLPQEEFWSILLNARLHIISQTQIGRGTVNSCPVNPRDVFRQAIRENASALVLVHNHPSGDTTPSVEDRELTNNLVKAGKMVGVKVVDHVIVTSDSYYSLIV